jgi:GT2 family glycosyltransferase
MQVSVIVPLYNKAAHVTRCLESISRQTFPDFEIIVVDDGSTDNSAGIARAFGDPRCRVFTQPNAGPGAARNRGAAEAAGELLAFLDADDEWLPDYLSSNVEVLQQSDASVAATACGYLESGINLEPMWRARGLTDGVFSVDADTSPLLMVYAVAFMSPWNTLIRAKVFRQLGGFYAHTRALYSEDAWLWAQVLLNYGVSIRFAPVLALFHREASELSANVRGMRPVEPFLLEPGPLWENCPAERSGMLHSFLAIRAFKTSCALGYWGRWREARELFRRFAAPRDIRLPYFWQALIFSSPLSVPIGKTWRKLGRNIALSDVERARKA